MTPIQEYRITSERDQKMISEIEEFLAAGCQAAELWKDETVGSERNVQLYYRAARRMGVKSGLISFHQKRGNIIVRRTSK